jgi:hypothetical protein
VQIGCRRRPRASRTAWWMMNWHHLPIRILPILLNGLPVDEVGWRPRCPLATHTRVCSRASRDPLPLLAIAHGVVVERGLLREGNAGCGHGSSSYSGWRVFRRPTGQGFLKPCPIDHAVNPLSSSTSDVREPRKACTSRQLCSTCRSPRQPATR